MVLINVTPYDLTPIAGYPFELDNFQKYAINAINKKNNVLITAHTGSGKTLPAEYAMEKSIFEGKRVIYTAPIKSLSNQKYQEFTARYPNITFGLITGDIKCNPTAQCLIMTTEILRNALFEHKMENKVKNSFEMDFENELACIVFDEVHYINDTERGRVWEESIMLTPKNTFMVMLSATISRVEKFAEWVEETTKRTVEICPNDKRVIPLTHHMYVCCPDAVLNKLEKTKATFYKQLINKPLVIKDKEINNINFCDSNYYNVSKIMSDIYKHNGYVKQSYVLNNVTKYLAENDMLPAICFIFSRKLVEKYAKMVNLNLIDNSNDVEQMCHSIVKKIPNYNEYIETAEFKQIIKLLRKGIAIHHSGLIPIVKEMIEILFSRGCIKLLFATETFAVGVNMPTKTVMFANLQKINNSGTFRNLLPQEYTQMAGRAGRRGLDPIGHVIHLINLIKDVPSHQEYRHIVSGNSQQIVSKFKIHNNLILRLINANTSLNEFTTTSMITHEICKEIKQYELELGKLNKQTTATNPSKDILDYHALYKEYNFNGYTNKYKKINKEMKSLERLYPNIENEHKKYIKSLTHKRGIKELEQRIQNTQNYIVETIEIIKTQLLEDGFIEKTNDKYKLTPIGCSATHIQEAHSLILSELLMRETFRTLEINDIISVLSVFVPVRTNEEPSIELLKDRPYYEETKYIRERNDYFKAKDERYMLDVGEDYTFQTVLCDAVDTWLTLETSQNCNSFLQELTKYGIFTGEFIKSILKINAIAKEMSAVCDVHNFIELKQKLDRVPELTMKHVVSNVSLYV